MIKQAIDILKQGGVLLYPTDTVCGLGCDATNPGAIARLNSIKQRPSGKSYIVLVHTDALLNRIFPEIPAIAWDLIDQADKPLTLVLDGATGMSKALLADDGSLAVRMVKAGTAFELLKQWRKPLVSTSANLSGQPTPRYTEEVNALIREQADMVLPETEEDTPTGEPSSIIKLKSNGEIRIIR